MDFDLVLRNIRELNVIAGEGQHFIKRTKDGARLEVRNTLLSKRKHVIFILFRFSWYGLLILLLYWITIHIWLYCLLQLCRYLFFFFFFRFKSQYHWYSMRMEYSCLAVPSDHMKKTWLKYVSNLKFWSCKKLESEKDYDEKFLYKTFCTSC